MIRMTLASALLGLGTAGCVVPVELADGNDGTEGGTAGGAQATTAPATTTSATGEGSDDQDDGTTDPTGCPPGELGCDCLLDTCEDGLVCFEEVCIVDMCGDDEVDLGEQCDDGNTDDADGCNNDCRTSGTVSQTIDLNGEAEQSGSFAVAVDSTDAVVVSGFDRIAGAQTGWVRKLDPAGNELWFDQLPTYVSPYALATGPDDRIATGGNLWLPPDIFGTTWNRSYAADGTVEQTNESETRGTRDVAFTPTGAILSGEDNQLIAMNPDPQGQWSLAPDFRALAIIPGGGFLVVGGLNTIEDTYYISRYADATTPGAPEWTIEDQDAPATDVDIDSAGNIFVSGSVDNGTDGSTSWVRKLAPDGSELWLISANGLTTTDLVIQSLAVDGQDRIVIAGHEDLGTITRPWIGKLDQEGGLLWEIATTEDQGMVNSIAIDSNDEILAATLVNSRAGLLRITP